MLIVLCALTGAQHDRPTSPRRPLTVGIVDTGIDPAVVPGIDVHRSRSLVPGEPVLDVDGHGTEMASIVQASAPGAVIVAVKVVDRHGATDDDRIAAAIAYLDRADADVALMSLAGAEPLPRTRSAIAAAPGLLVVAAAGNDGLDLATHASYPGGYRLRNLLTVAAASDDGQLLASSNWNAPSTIVAAGTVGSCGLGGRPVWATGTSPAAAVVAASVVRHGAAPDGTSAAAPLLPTSTVSCGGAERAAGSRRSG